jgi:hypothetical protein
MLPSANDDGNAGLPTAAVTQIHEQTIRQLVANIELFLTQWDAMIERANLIQEELAASTTPYLAATPSDPPAPRRKGRGANIDARMLKTLSDRPESLDWSCRQWAEHLGCACSTVAGTTTWKIRIPQARSLYRAERIRRGFRR